MMIQLSYFPGQTATLFLETVDGYGVRVDNPTLPVVERVIFPDFSVASGFPQNMTKIDTGLYYFHLVLPTGGTSIGSYLADVSYINPEGYENLQSYQILVNAPFGMFTAGLTL